MAVVTQGRIIGIPFDSDEMAKLEKVKIVFYETNKIRNFVAADFFLSLAKDRFLCFFKQIQKLY